MPDLIDIRDQMPADITRRLLTEEPAYYYAVGSGCLGMGGKEWFALTDRRVLMTTKEGGAVWEGRSPAPLIFPSNTLPPFHLRSRKGACPAVGPLW
jgi:hypothetical protein